VKITYVTHTRFPTEKAHGHQVAQVCAALGKLGHEVTLVHPTIWTGIEGDIWGYYNVVKQSFKVLRIKSFDALSAWWVPGSLAFTVSMWSYRRALRKFFKDHKADLFYCRSWEVLDPMLATGTRAILELHTLPRRGLRKFVKQCNACWKVICLTSPMRDEVLRLGVQPDKVIVESDGVDLARFSHVKRYTKEEWELPANIPIIGYVGSFVTQNNVEKGIGELVEALGVLKERGRNVFGLIVGGVDRGNRYGKKGESCGLIQLDNFQIRPQISSELMPSVLSWFDICVYPAPRSSHPYFMRDTSPLKLFEYLAAGKPIACADLPPIRDIVDETMVTFCEPGNPQSIADAIEWALSHSEEAQKKAQKGKEHVKRFDWKERMKRILEE